MKVRISYGVELEEVPAKAAEMIHKAARKLNDQLSEMEAASDMLASNRAVEATVQMIDEVRLSLADVDSSLNDAVSIVSGFLKAMKPEEPAPMAVPMPEPAMPEPAMPEPDEDCDYVQ